MTVVSVTDSPVILIVRSYQFIFLLLLVAFFVELEIVVHVVEIINMQIDCAHLSQTQILEAAYKEPYTIAVLAAQSSEDEGEETVPGTRSVGVQTEFPIVRVDFEGYQDICSKCAGGLIKTPTATCSTDIEQ